MPQWKPLFRQVVGSYFKYILLFVLNAILSFMVTLVIDLSFLMHDWSTILQTIILALLNVALILNIGFSFVQLHRYLVGRTIQKAGNTFLENYITPSIESVVSKLTTPPTSLDNDSSTRLLKRSLLQQVKKEHINTGLKYILLLIFRRVNLKNIKWTGDKPALSSFLNKRSAFVLNVLAAMDKRMLWFCFLTNWIIVLVLLVFRFLVH